jgi:hypothetical protein
VAEQRRQLPFGGVAPIDYEFQAWDTETGRPRAVKPSELVRRDGEESRHVDFMWPDWNILDSQTSIGSTYAPQTLTSCLRIGEARGTLRNADGGFATSVLGVSHLAAPPCSSCSKPLRSTDPQPNYQA